MQEAALKVADLERKVGQLTMELDRLKGLLRLEREFAYLAVILDAWLRKVVGYAVGHVLYARLPLAALEAALDSRRPPPGLIHHSVQDAIEHLPHSLRRSTTGNACTPPWATDPRRSPRPYMPDLQPRSIPRPRVSTFRGSLHDSGTFTFAANS
jgi:hypothetical protein